MNDDLGAIKLLIDIEKEIFSGRVRNISKVNTIKKYVPPFLFSKYKNK